ncbi:hypothetical protein [Streptomyces nitrosporeus]|uniref:hypothetical protein n=1 Tax=Streptomyces nitrosporeus TaxID=28894 RepID=UPI0019B44923|nr:hypothetical protein [Streptomyces nitrosporeus]GGZ20320.1 hypothetical protein GCM10010327_59280 [Streptomyces nitrosporeus]
MTHQDERIHDTVPPPGRARPAPDRPRPAAGRTGRTPRPGRPVRTTLAWVWLVAGLAALLTGIGIGHGLLIAAGLVVAGVGGQLFDPDRRPGGRRRTAL